MLQVGDMIPDFILPSDTIGDVSAAGLRGQRFVLYFYPKDNTSGCNAEACSFRDNLAGFNNLNVPVFGISPDSIKAHAGFRAKFNLTFPLLSDEEHKTAEGFGTWVEKSPYGRKYMGIQRSTFIVGPSGFIERVWQKVTPAEHAPEVLAYLSQQPDVSAADRLAALETADEPVAMATAFEEIVIAKTEVTEVETETVNEVGAVNTPQPAAKAPKKSASKKKTTTAQSAPASQVVDLIVVDSMVEVPGEPPIEVVEVFEVQPEPAATPAPAVKKPAAKKAAPAAKKVAPAAKKPAPAAKKVAPAAKKAAPAAKKVAPAAKKAAPAAKKVAPAAKKAAPAAKKVTPAAKKPAPAAKKPAPVAKKPAPAAKKPAPVAKKPAPAAKKPAPAAKKPAAAAKKPAAAAKKAIAAPAAKKPAAKR